MKKVVLCILAMLIASPAFASSITSLNLRELPEKSELIVLGHVLKVVPNGDSDTVTLRVVSALKGHLSDQELSFTLVSRGGIKDFDPELKTGDNGVFFLKKVQGGYQKAYWGSVAVFNKNNFKWNEDKP